MVGGETKSQTSRAQESLVKGVAGTVACSEARADGCFGQAAAELRHEGYAEAIVRAAKLVWEALIWKALVEGATREK